MDAQHHQLRSRTRRWCGAPVDEPYLRQICHYLYWPCYWNYQPCPVQVRSEQVHVCTTVMGNFIADIGTDSI